MPWWKGRGRGGWGGGPWPGNGPWSHLPPWERPGWRLGLGPGACWRLYGAPGWLAWLRGLLPWSRASTAPPFRPEDELRLLEDYKQRLQEALQGIEERIRELRRQLEEQG